MIRVNNYTAFLFLLIIILLASCTNQNTNLPSQDTLKSPITSQEIGNRKGNIAIDFTVTTIDGRDVSLNDYIGKKPLILYFWASWCPYCEKDFSVVRNVYRNYKDDVEFLAVDLDLTEDKNIIEKYKMKHNLNDIDFAVGNTKILSDYSIRLTTTKFAIAKNGTILWTGSGEVDENVWNILFQGLRVS